ncbi:hypothetical protein HDU80_011494 [Chytriomyces hyalinus]|nr:hypothetical protein HDU80_011494 [Chytriomyces hyalinus]
MRTSAALLSAVPLVLAADPQQPLIAIPLTKAPMSANRALSENGTTAVTVRNLGDAAYFADVSLGTPAQQFIFHIDTGSSAAWVGSKACNMKLQCNDRASFDQAKSSTFVDISNGTLSDIKYGSGQVFGYNAKDTFKWGPLTIPNQQFMLVSREDDTIFQEQGGYVDGLIGLSFQGGIKDQPAYYYPTVIGNMIENKLISSPVFSMWLNGTSEANGLDWLMNGGEIVFGGIDTTRYSGTLQYFPVVDPYFWAVKLEGVSVGSTVVSLDKRYSAMLDSGTSLIYIHTDALLPLLAPIYGALGMTAPSPTKKGFYIVPCDRSTALPDIQIQLGNFNYPLSWFDYVIALDENVCALGVVAGGTAKEMNYQWILGDVFLRRYFSVYDFGDGNAASVAASGARIGLATAAHSSKPYTGVTTRKTSGSERLGAGVVAALLFLLWA